MFNLEGLIPKLCELAQEVGDDERALRMRFAGLEVLASMEVKVRIQWKGLMNCLPSFMRLQVQTRGIEASIRKQMSSIFFFSGMHYVS